MCPWQRDLLDGLLGADVVGVQTEEDRDNFLDAAETALDADVDRDEGIVHYRDRTTRVHAYPVGVDCANRHLSTTPASPACRESVRRRLGLPSDVRLAVGVDRLDYTKGIPEKVLAVERLLERRPNHIGRFVFVQVAEPSRDCLAAYRAIRSRIVSLVERVNQRFGHEGYCPVILLEAHHEPSDVYRLYRAADVCYVGSLHDGMNLVAKEFVAARSDERGVLVLSQFAGAARQLDAALIVNPYAIDCCADTLERALTMTPAEQTRRMKALRATVHQYDSRWWAGQLLHGGRPAAETRRVAVPRPAAAEASV
jgi:trehalose 6-phosphate synthase